MLQKYFFTLGLWFGLPQNLGFCFSVHAFVRAWLSHCHTFAFAVRDGTYERGNSRLMREGLRAAPLAGPGLAGLGRAPSTARLDQHNGITAILYDAGLIHCFPHLSLCSWIERIDRPASDAPRAASPMPRARGTFNGNCQWCRRAITLLPIANLLSFACRLLDIYHFA